MTFDYVEAQTDAEALIEEFGGTMTIQRASPGDPPTDPWNPSEPGTPTDTTVKGVIIDYETNEVDGSKILSGDQKVLIAAKGMSIVPDQNDLLIVPNDATYQIVTVKRLRPNPQSVTVLFELQVRR